MHSELKRDNRFTYRCTPPSLSALSFISRPVKSITGRLFMCPSAEMSGRKGHIMKIRMYYESKLDRDVIVLDVPDEECEVMIENDYRQRLEKARPEDRDSVRRRDAQTIIDEECNKPTYNNHHAETRRHVSLDALDPAGKHISDGTDLSDLFNEVDSDELRMAIRYLKPKQRDLIQKIFWRNISLTEIARSKGVSVQAVHDELQYIFRRLKKILNFDV